MDRDFFNDWEINADGWTYYKSPGYIKFMNMEKKIHVSLTYYEHFLYMPEHWGVSACYEESNNRFSRVLHDDLLPFGSGDFVLSFNQMQKTIIIS